MAKQFSPEEIKYVIAEKIKGTGSRAIGKKLGRSKSAVNYVWGRNKDSVSEKKFEGPKILLFDLEVAPELKLGYNRAKDFTPAPFVMTHHFIFSFAAKLLGQDTIFYKDITAYESYEPMVDCDEELVRELHTMMDDADIVIAHNLKGFDWGVANARFVKYGLPPISPVKLTDTLKIARSEFRFPNNRLNTIATYLDLPQKVEIDGPKLWRGCYLGDEDSWKLNEEYNIGDIITLEGVYLKLRPFDKRHPNLAIYYPDTTPRCVCCGSTNLIPTDKKSYTSVSQFEVHQCGDCGKHNRTRVNELDKEKRSALLMNCQ